MSIFKTTAKVFVCMTVFAALASTITSCSKDDNEEEVRLNFVNNMMQSPNALSCTWEGWHRRQFKDGSSWRDHSRQYAVIRFDRSSITATSGEGILLYFTNDSKDSFKEGSKFVWSFEDNQIKLRHLTHSEWYPMYAEYNTAELTISGGSFYGHWWEKVYDRWEFTYKKSNFNDWVKYPL